jgi:hypothetical protein
MCSDCLNLANTDRPFFWTERTQYSAQQQLAFTPKF